METLIVICLLIVIFLLLQDKIVSKKGSGQTQETEKVNPKLPDIMGQPKPVRSQTLPMKANKCQMEPEEINPDNLDIEYDENEEVSIQIPQEELDEVFSNNVPDFEEEEEEWHNHRISNDNDGFAQGVTFEELGTVGALLQKEKLDSAQKETAAPIIQKIQGTELFDLLESSVKDASRKIAELLDSTLTTDTEDNSSNLRKDDFDIEEFL
ncbi:conjugal transfer protein TraD [Flavobacterium dauae]|uniref:conjugal transfer protein TraD n=1 Tax=Flavobacterium dauae TaxID=1563479 RepID=UPI00101CBD2A|nr:conjugal transfer protein TraD [Flavobacterium dauae]WLD23292.1 conjugal transfer protein TraD [Flavobacterium dauae]